MQLTSCVCSRYNQFIWVRLCIAICLLIIQFMWHVSWLSLRFPVSYFCFLSFFFSLVVYGNFGLTFIFLLNILKCACSFSMHKANVVALRRDSWTLSWVRLSSLDLG